MRETGAVEVDNDRGTTDSVRDERAKRTVEPSEDTLPGYIVSTETLLGRCNRMLTSIGVADSNDAPVLNPS